MRPKTSVVVRPPVVRPGDEVTTVGRVFDTPLVVKGRTWFPLTQLITWPIMAWVAGKRQPERSLLARLGVGAVTMPVVLGSEWCHNLAHAAAAHRVGKPMDAIRVVWGMPLLVYYDIEDERVEPRQHILRALGGPVFNALALSVAVPLRGFLRPSSIGREIQDIAVRTNAFLLVAGLLPIPGLDGGPILKWTLVARGHNPKEADRAVRKVDGVVGMILALFGVRALRKRRWLVGGLCLQLAAAALSFAFGIIKEQE